MEIWRLFWTSNCSRMRAFRGLAGAELRQNGLAQLNYKNRKSDKFGKTGGLSCWGDYFMNNSLCIYVLLAVPMWKKQLCWHEPLSEVWKIRQAASAKTVFSCFPSMFLLSKSLRKPLRPEFNSNFLEEKCLELFLNMERKRRKRFSFVCVH